MRKRKTHGGALIEFFLLFPFLCSLIIGTLVYGTQIVKELQLQLVARDIASMSARGTSFNSAANQEIASRLGAGMGWPATGGLLSTSPGVIYVSTIEYIDSTCNGITPVCSNAGYWVFLKSVKFGNTGLRSSSFGAPAACTPGCYDPNQSDGSLLSSYTQNNTGARVSNFNFLGTPDKNVAGFQPGQPTYVVEVAGVTGPWHGGSVSYALSIF
jgi:hypothetical protein